MAYVEIWVSKVVPIGCPCLYSGTGIVQDMYENFTAVPVVEKVGLLNSAAFAA